MSIAQRGLKELLYVIGEVAVGGFIMTVCAVFLWNLFTVASNAPTYDPIGPVLWPAILGVGIVILQAVNILLALRKGGKNKPAERLDLSLGRLLRGKLFLAFACFAVYILLLDQIGFVLSTPLFIFSYMTLLGHKSWKVRIATMVIANGVLFLVFSWLLQVPLPRGYGIFREISMFFEMF